MLENLNDKPLLSIEKFDNFIDNFTEDYENSSDDDNNSWSGNLDEKYKEYKQFGKTNRELSKSLEHKKIKNI